MKRKELSILAGVLLVAFAIRLIFYPHSYLYGVDPYYHYGKYLFKEDLL